MKARKLRKPKESEFIREIAESVRSIRIADEGTVEGRALDREIERDIAQFLSTLGRKPTRKQESVKVLDRLIEIDGDVANRRSLRKELAREMDEYFSKHFKKAV